jgi:hypothetical protein
MSNQKEEEGVEGNAETSDKDKPKVTLAFAFHPEDATQT